MPRLEFSMCQRDCCMKADNEMSVVSGGHSDTKKILPNIRISLLRSYPYYLSSPLCFMAREGWLIFSSLKNEGKKIFISHFCPIALTNSHFLQGKRVLKNPLLFHFWWWLNEVINETLSDKRKRRGWKLFYDFCHFLKLCCWLQAIHSQVVNGSD